MDDEIHRIYRDTDATASCFLYGLDLIIKQVQMEPRIISTQFTSFWHSFYFVLSFTILFFFIKERNKKERKKDQTDERKKERKERIK